MNYIKSVILAGLLVPGFLGTAAAAPGRTGTNYLKIDVGAKATALAGTQFATENDSFAQYYNPALMSGISQKEIGFMHSEFVQDVRQEAFAYVYPTINRGNFAASFDYFTYGKISGYDATGGSIGDITASDITIGGSWAKKWDLVYGERRIEDFSTGASLKILSRKLYSDSAAGFALDLGASYPFHHRRLHGLRAAFAVQNLSNGIKFKNESSPLPRIIRMGFAYSWWGEAMTATLDEVVPADNTPFAALGLEYKIRKMVSIRLGYKGEKKTDQKVSYGFGFENPIFRLDYAFVPYDDLGNTHRISVIYRFGKTTRRATADDQLKRKLKDAQEYYAQGLLVDAFVISFQLQRVAPWLEENNNFLAKVQKDFKELEESDKKEKLLQQAQALFNRAEQFFDAGNLLDARTEFQAVVALQPDNKAALGYLNHIEGQFKSFIESFYRAAMIAFAEEDYAKAKEEFEKVLVINPDHEESKVQLAKCNEMLETKAKKEQEEAQKNLVENTYKDAIDAYGKGNYEDAFSLFSEVLKIMPQNSEAQRYYDLCKETIYTSSLANGKDNAAKGNWDSAIKNLRKANEINPTKEAKSALDDAQRRWGLQKKVISQNLYKEGLEAFLSGDKAKAQAAWKRAVDLDPDNEEAKRGMQRLNQ